MRPTLLHNQYTHTMMILSIVIVTAGIGVVIWQQILENKHNSAKGNF
jgi:general stress protein CsbA